MDILKSFKLVDGNQAAAKVLTSDASGVGTWQTAGGGGGGWVKVSDETLGAAAAAFTLINGLNIDLHGLYKFSLMYEGDYGFQAAIQFNGDATAANYSTMRGAVLSSVGSWNIYTYADNFLTYGSHANSSAHIIGEVSRPAAGNGQGKALVTFSGFEMQPDVPDLRMSSGGVWYKVAANITSLRIVSDTGGMFKTGSRLIVWRPA